MCVVCRPPFTVARDLSRKWFIRFISFKARDYAVRVMLLFCVRLRCSIVTIFMIVLSEGEAWPVPRVRLVYAVRNQEQYKTNYYNIVARFHVHVIIKQNLCISQFSHSSYKSLEPRFHKQHDELCFAVQRKEFVHFFRRKKTICILFELHTTSTFPVPVTAFVVFATKHRRKQEYGMRTKNKMQFRVQNERKWVRMR